MIYFLTSFFCAFSLSLVLCSVVIYWRRRNFQFLWIAFVALLFGLSFFILTLPASGRVIDISFNRLLRGGLRPDAIGFHIPSFLGGLLLGAVFVALTSFAVPGQVSKGQRLAPGKAAVLLSLALLFQIAAARELTLDAQLDLLRSVEKGAEDIAAQDHQIMMSPSAVADEYDVTVTDIYTDLAFPTALEFAESGRVFVAERAGSIYTAASLTDDLQHIFTFENVETEGEAGLLDIEVHPSYPDQPYLYIYYTETPFARNRLVRLNLSNVGSPQVEIILDDIPAARFHNSGGMAFDREESLFVATGESTHLSAGRLYETPPGVQDPDDIRGKILRMNSDGSIPDDNPWPGSRTYALGFRSTYRLRFDPASGALFAAENGPDVDDEVNLISRGGNYGWPIVTGYTGSESFEDPVLTIPIPVAITGLEVYRGGGAYDEAFVGDVFFCGFNTGWVYRLPLETDAPIRPSEATTVFKPDSGRDCRLDLRQGPDGAMYYTGLSGVYRLNIE